MKKVILIALMSALSTVTFAQRVYRANADGTKNTSGDYHVIDCTKDNMPAGALGKPNSPAGRVERHIESDTPNAKVSPKFAVSKQNINNAGEYGGTGSIISSNRLTWAVAAGWDATATTGANYTLGPNATADTGCSQHQGPKGGETGLWRLPTQRELMLIWIMHEGLKKSDPTGFTSFTSTNYWSATENNTNIAWGVNFINGSTINTSKTSDSYVRCVRDL